MKKPKIEKKTNRSKIVKSNNSAHLNYITIKRIARTTPGMKERERRGERGRDRDREIGSEREGGSYR